MSTYTAPTFHLWTVLQIKDEQQTAHVNYSCRELVISSLFNRLRSIKQILAAKKQKVNEKLIRQPLKLSLSFSETSYGKALTWNKLISSEARRQQVHELAAFACLIPVLLAIGPRGVWRQDSHVSNSNSLNLDCFSSLILAHPALVSVVLGQARWACDIVANKRLASTMRQLKVEERLKLLWKLSKKVALNQKDRAYLLACLNELHKLGNLAFVRYSPKRYGILSHSGYKRALQNLLKAKSPSVLDSWLDAAKVMGPYSGINAYGFHTWARAKYKLKPLTPLRLPKNKNHKSVH